MSNNGTLSVSIYIHRWMMASGEVKVLLLGIITLQLGSTKTSPGGSEGMWMIYPPGCRHNDWKLALKSAQDKIGKPTNSRQHCRLPILEYPNYSETSKLVYTNSHYRLYGQLSWRSGNLLISEHQPPIRGHQDDWCQVSFAGNRSFQTLHWLHWSNSSNEAKILKTIQIDRVEQVQSGLPVGCLAS